MLFVKARNVQMAFFPFLIIQPLFLVSESACTSLDPTCAIFICIFTIKLVIVFTKTLSVVGNNEDVLNLFDLKIRTVADLIFRFAD